jgi:hypothetical protein
MDNLFLNIINLVLNIIIVYKVLENKTNILCNNYSSAMYYLNIDQRLQNIEKEMNPIPPPYESTNLNDVD